MDLDALDEFSPDIYEKVDLDGDGQEEIIFGYGGNGIDIRDFFAILGYKPTGWEELFYKWSGGDAVEVRYTIRDDRIEVNFVVHNHGTPVNILSWDQFWVRCKAGRCWEIWSAELFEDSWFGGAGQTKVYNIGTLEELSQDTIRLTRQEFSVTIPSLDNSVTPPTLRDTAERIVGPDLVETYQWDGEHYALIAREQRLPKTTITGEVDYSDDTGWTIYTMMRDSFTRPDGSVDENGLDKARDTLWGTTSEESRTLITSSNGALDELGSVVAIVSHIPKYPTCYLIAHRHEAGQFTLLGRTEFSCSANFTRLAWADVTGDGIDELLLLTIPQEPDRFWHRLHIYTLNDSLEELTTVEGEINGGDGVGIYWEEEPFALFLGLPFYNQGCGIALSCLDLTRRFAALRWDAASGSFKEVMAPADSHHVLHVDRAAHTARRVGEIPCRVVMVHLHRLPIPRNRVGVPVALVEVGAGEHCPLFALASVDAKAIQQVAHEGGMLAARGGVREAGGHAVVVIDAASLRVTLAAILRLVRDGIAARRIQGIEEHRARQQDADGSGHAGWLRGQGGGRGQFDAHLLLADSVRVAVRLIGIIRRGDGVGAGRVRG